MNRDNQTIEEKTPAKSKPIFIRGGYFDYQTFFLMMFLVLFGLVMLYSASSYRGAVYAGSSWFFVKRQAVFMVLGLVLMLVVSHFNYDHYKKFAVILMFIAIVLCIIVFALGTASHGATRWIPIGPIQFQPSEVAKPIIIIYMANVCISRRKSMLTIKGFFTAVAPAIGCIGLIAWENLSTAIVCTCIVIGIIFVAYPKLWYFIPVIIAGIILVVLLFTGDSYRSDRIDTWLNPEDSSNSSQTIQSLYAIGSGGLFGRGLGQSIQKMGFLPESHNDMIFSVICEELGIIGGLGVLIVFVMLFIRMIYIAYNAKDAVGGLISVGVLIHIAIQLFINVGVATNTIPPTGVTLPFISYGGTSLVFLMIEIGMVLGVSRQMRPYKK